MPLDKETNGSGEPDVTVDASLASPPLKRDKRPWTPEEDEALMLAVLDIKQKRGFDENEEDDEDWDEIAESVPERTAFQCYQRYIRYLHKPSSSSRTDDLSLELNHTTTAKKEDKGTKSVSTRSKIGSLKDDEDYEDQPDPGKRKRGAGESSSKKTSPKESSGSKKKSAQVDASTRDASPSKWTPEETQLLRKLVEQYQDSKLIV